MPAYERGTIQMREEKETRPERPGGDSWPVSHPLASSRFPLLWLLGMPTILGAGGAPTTVPRFVSSPAAAPTGASRLAYHPPFLTIVAPHKWEWGAKTVDHSPKVKKKPISDRRTGAPYNCLLPHRRAASLFSYHHSTPSLEISTPNQHSTTSLYTITPHHHSTPSLCTITLSHHSTPPLCIITLFHHSIPPLSFHTIMLCHHSYHYSMPLFSTITLHHHSNCCCSVSLILHHEQRLCFGLSQRASWGEGTCSGRLGESVHHCGPVQKHCLQGSRCFMARTQVSLRGPFSTTGWGTGASLGTLNHTAAHRSTPHHTAPPHTAPYCTTPLHYTTLQCTCWQLHRTTTHHNTPYHQTIADTTVQ